jgi:hypothetical protein
MRWGNSLFEAKLTETDFQCREARLVEAYRDFDLVFDRDQLPRVQIRIRRRREAMEFAEEFTQEWEAPCETAEEVAHTFRSELVTRFDDNQPRLPGYASYQLIRNVLAAYAANSNFCVIHDERRPDLREAWLDVMLAVKNSEMRVRCMALTWQEIVPFLPEELQAFLDVKYGIAASGTEATSMEDLESRLP